MLLNEDTEINGRLGDTGASEIFNSGHGLTREADIALGKKIMEKLVSFYPMHNWGIEVNHEAGHAVIRLIYKDTQGNVRVSNYGYVMHIQNIQDEASLTERVKKAGGEWLERYNMKRGRANPDEIAMAHVNAVDLTV